MIYGLTCSTDMNQGLRDDPERKKYYENLAMLKRISDPHEIAGQVVFLLSERASCQLLLMAPTKAADFRRLRHHWHRHPRRWRCYGMVKHDPAEYKACMFHRLPITLYCDILYEKSDCLT